MKIETWLLNLLKETVNPQTLQWPAITKEECLSTILQSVKQGASFLVGYKEYGTAFLIVSRTQFVGELHVFSNSTSSWSIVKASRSIMGWIKQSPYIKIEARSSSKDVITLAKRNGWQVEGYCRNSFINPDKTISDEVLFGFINHS